MLHLMMPILAPKSKLTSQEFSELQKGQVKVVGKGSRSFRLGGGLRLDRRRPIVFLSFF